MAQSIIKRTGSSTTFSSFSSSPHNTNNTNTTPRETFSFSGVLPSPSHFLLSPFKKHFLLLRTRPWTTKNLSRWASQPALPRTPLPRSVHWLHLLLLLVNTPLTSGPLFPSHNQHKGDIEAALIYLTSPEVAEEIQRHKNQEV
jgi:hypothetical protein